MVGAQRRLRLLVGPADAIDVDEIAADQHRGGDAGEQVVVDVALHGRMGRFEIVAGGGHLQVVHACFLHAVGRAARRNTVIHFD